ncbi:MAG: tRNA pseudouridine(38-40) synthase TruA [Christensenellales bacterium]
MKNIKITFSYEGRNYFGLQKQTNKTTVQGEIENALFLLLKVQTNIILAGRTDKGVSAQGMVANFETNSKINPEKFCYALNVLLPNDIRILKSEQVNSSFHARHSAKKKTYCYAVYENKFELPLFPFECQVKTSLDFSSMKKAIRFLKGKKDFSSFATNSKQYDDCVRKIFKAKVERKNILGINHYYFYFTGDGFLYNQVRNMVGTIIMAGNRKIKPTDVKNIIKGKNRCLAGSCFPPKGLSLLNIEY